MSSGSWQLVGALFQLATSSGTCALLYDIYCTYFNIVGEWLKLTESDVSF